ncbi:MAG: hypothetical protein AAFY59_12805, partial [Pseudomonadota bacterium]
MKFLVLSVSLLAAASAATANERVVYGGGDPAKSTYSGVIVPHTLEVFTGAGIGGYEWSGVTAGTGENLVQVSLNPLGFGVGQSDMVLNAIEEGEPIKVYYTNMGPECFHVISKDGSDFAKAVAGGAPIYVGSELSGTAWSVQSLLREGYEVDPATLDIRFEPVSNAASGGIGVFVQRPDPNASVYKTYADQGFAFTGVDSIEAELAGYTPLEITVKDSGVLLGLGSKSQSFRSTCMTTVLFGHKPENVDATTREGKYL